MTVRELARLFCAIALLSAPGAASGQVPPPESVPNGAVNVAPPIAVATPPVPVPSLNIGLPPLVVTPPLPRVERHPAPPVEIQVPPISVKTEMSIAARPATSEIIPAHKPAVDANAAFGMTMSEAKAAIAKVRDYSGHIIHQIRVKGELQSEQTAEIRARTTPRSISLKYIAPAGILGKELVFVDGKNTNKVRVKQPGNYGPLAFASASATDAKATVDGKTALTSVGVAATVDWLDKLLATEARLKNPVVVSAADFNFAGRPATRYELVMERPHALRSAHRVVVYVDPDTKLPVRLELYDAPTGSATAGELRTSFSYVNLKFNQGLGDAVFDK